MLRSTLTLRTFIGNKDHAVEVGVPMFVQPLEEHLAKIKNKRGTRVKNFAAFGVGKFGRTAQ